VGDWEVGWNTGLSAMDKQFIRTQYPFDERPTTVLTIGAAPTQAAIGKHGEEDLYRFDMEHRSPCTIETEGRTDVLVGVFGPNDRTRLVAQDDDSGQGRNAKISAVLAPGTYTVKVRHFRPRGTGHYRIAVRSA
jgi:tyrosinase